MPATGADSPRDAPLDYRRLVRELFPRLTGGIRWGLDRTERMLADAGDPQRSYPVIHVGGTNGKGTVCAVAESVLRAAGLRTGLYTSPHLTSFRERVRIDGVPISEGALLESANRLWPSIEREAPSFFEATTAIAFDAFARAGVDVAVVEVGLGGRLDATNVVAPDVAVVTHISVDHVDFLGSDPAGIAREKAGIAKAGAPFLTAEPDDALFGVLAGTAGAAGASVRRMMERPQIVDHDVAGTRFRADTAWGPIDARLPLAGAHQATNALLAVRALELSRVRDEIDADAVRRGIEATRWPGRFQVERVGAATWIFDVAHNPAAIERLCATLRDVGPSEPVTLRLGVMGDKDWSAMLRGLGSVAERLVLTRPAHAPAGRAWDPRAAAGAAAALGIDTRLVEELAAAVRGLREEARGTVVVTGSFHTVGEALEALGIDLGWPADPSFDDAVDGAADPALQR
ncbi:MAG TPA: folylpolyglutamate synthase/dihydrofolate synthase family protein [Longimicrobiales bacterium]